MADATSVNCNGKRIYGNNDGDDATATVTATMKATATALAMAKAMVAMWLRRRQGRISVRCGSDVVFCGVDICFIIVIQLPLVCGSGGRSFASSFYYM